MDIDVSVDDESVDGDVSTGTVQEQEAEAYGVAADGTRIGTSRGDSADEIDPQKLVSDPSINELRWFKRRTFADKIVDKPIEDAFKNGFELTGDGSNRARTLLDSVEYIDNYKLDEMKSRRDGFSLLMYVLRDTSEGAHIDPTDENVRVDDLQAVNILTIDDLSDTPPDNFEEQLPVPIDVVDVRDTGMVIDQRVNSADYNDPIGYIVEESDTTQFVHANRVQHYVWNREVDGDMENDVLGRWEGDSVLLSSYDLIKGLKKGNWSLAQTLFRYASKMYSIKMPGDASEDEISDADENLKNLNAKSEVILPSPEYEMDDYQTDGQLNPREYFDVIFEQICASTEMTKSVLFGTQQGTVTGSETDIKNYFNKVERYRRNRAEKFIREFVEDVTGLIDGRTNDDYESEFEFEWGPMFRLNDLDRVEVQHREMQTIQAAVNGFTLTPDEGRSILSERWADVDLDDLTDKQKEWLEDINLGQEGVDPDGGSTQQQNGGGREKGGSDSSTDPTTDSGREVYEVI